MRENCIFLHLNHPFWFQQKSHGNFRAIQHILQYLSQGNAVGSCRAVCDLQQYNSH